MTASTYQRTLCNKNAKGPNLTSTHQILANRLAERGFVPLRLRHIFQSLRQMCTQAICGFLLISVLSVSVWASDVRPFRPFEHFRDCDVCSEMVVLPSGKYMMGATEEEFKGKDQYRFMYTDETPRHEVRVASFALAKFDVKKREFSIFANETGFRGKGCHIFNGKEWITDSNADWKNPGFRQTDNDPVVCVSWDDAQKFIAWLNSKLPKEITRKYRLPTEEEWEYAARAGTVTATYWGDNAQDQCKYENTRDLTASFLDLRAPHADCTDGYVYTSPAGTFKPNPWGLFDMLGNVQKWVENCPDVGYPRPPITVATKPYSCGTRALRGASWASIPIGVRSAARGAMASSTRESIFGFRLAVDLSN